MNKENPSSREEEIMVEKQLVNQVRENLINSLKEAMETYGPDWVNREHCAKLIEDLDKKRPTIIRGPFFGDYLDAALHDLGIRSGTGTEIWRALEKGIGEQ